MANEKMKPQSPEEIARATQEAALEQMRAMMGSIPGMPDMGDMQAQIMAQMQAAVPDLAEIQAQQAAMGTLGGVDAAAVAEAALRQMLRQTGAPVYDADGYLQKGVIVRHLALPGHSDDSLAVLQRLADLRQETGVSFVPSLMSQFTPFYRAAEHGLGRRITTYEYRKVVDRAIALGLTDGYMQEKSSAREEYTPPFDLEGV